MKKILCFGDSNTYGYIPQTGQRYSQDERWCGVLQTLLGDNWEIIEQGCNNRTAFKDNPMGKIYIGYKILPEYLSNDLSWVILSIGINDLQTQYKTTIEEFETGLKKLINIVKETCPNTKILLLAPPRINEGILKGFFSTLFDQSAIEKSAQLSQIYGKIALETGCEFINLDAIIKTSSRDGLHLESIFHKIIADTIFNVIN